MEQHNDREFQEDFHVSSGKDRGIDGTDLSLSEDISENSRRVQGFIKTRAATKQPLTSLKKPSKTPNGPHKTLVKKTRAHWSNEALKLAIEGVDQGYSMAEVCRKYRIPKSSLRDHIVGRTRGRKMRPKTILSQEEEEKLCEYIDLMVHWGHPMTPTQLKNKVAEITQARVTPFKNGIPSDSWLKWFRRRHPHLVLRVPQGLNQKRTRALNSENVAYFYENLLYLEHNYPPNCIQNIDESGFQASQNGLGKVFAKRGIRGVHKVIPAKREWLSVLTAINAARETISNYYIFKDEANEKL